MSRDEAGLVGLLETASYSGNIRVRAEKQLINNAYQSRETDCEHTSSTRQICLNQLKSSTHTPKKRKKKKEKAADQMYLLPMIKKT